MPNPKMHKDEVTMIKELSDLFKVCNALFKQVMREGFGVIEAKSWAKANTAILQYLQGVEKEQDNLKELYTRALSEIIKVRFEVEQKSKEQNSVVGVAMYLLDPTEYDQIKKAQAILERLDFALHGLEQLRKQIEAKRVAELKALENMKGKAAPKLNPNIKTGATDSGSRLRNIFYELVRGLTAIMQYMRDGKTATLNNARVLFNKVSAGVTAIKGKTHKVTTPMFKRTSQPKPEVAANTKHKIRPNPNSDGNSIT